MSARESARARGSIQSSIDVLSEHVAVIDGAGRIVAVNAAWHDFARANGGNPRLMSVGANYLTVCDAAASRGSADAAAAAALIRQVIADHGPAPHAEMEYQCDSPLEVRWFRLKVSRSRVLGAPRYVIEHEHIAAPSMAERKIRLQANLLASVEQAVIATDLSGAIVYWNRHAERLYGWAAEQALGKNIVEFLPGPSSRAQAAHIMARLQRGESWSGEFEVRHRDGAPLQVRVTNSPMRDERNHLIGIIGVSDDISEQKKALKALSLSDMVYQAIGEAIMVVRIDGVVVAINPAFARLTGHDEAAIVGHSVDLLKAPEATHFFPQEAQPLLAKTGHWAGSIRCRRRDGAVVRDWLRIDTVYDDDGRDKLRVCMFSRITDQKRAKETIWQQANFDALTGLPNRSMFRDRLEHEIELAAREQRQLALMFLDLDQFKEVNDTLGHDTGDGLLQQAADRLVQCVRAIDTVARIGGDEFTVILGHLQDGAIVERVAHDIVRTLSEPFQVGQDTIHVSASVGITLYPDDAANADALIKNADQAMYAAKNAGRNQSHYFTHRMQHEAQVRMRLVNDLREALARGQFELAYQPIVDLAGGAIHKAEALLRWRHPLRGAVAPAEFIAVAEQTGMIGAIGEWVYEQAARQAALWRATIDPSFQISVNVSPEQLRKKGSGRVPLSEQLLADRARQRAGQARPSAPPVIVEITEGVLLEHSGAVLRQLQLLQDAGIELAIDDFGTGYSALSYLRRFHVDYLKIDQTFVTRLTEHSDDLSMCEAIIVMAHKLGIKVIAEGIEQETQRDLLAGAGCDFGQGFLFARPVTAQMMGSLLIDAA